jgi:ribonucleoside-diphosphate reductase alpha chain
VVDEIPGPAGGLSTEPTGSLRVAPADEKGSAPDRSALAPSAPSDDVETPSTAENEQPPTATAIAETEPAAPQNEDLVVIATANGNGNGKNGNGQTLESFAGSSLGGGVKVAFAAQADAPSCADCGSIMVRNGSCYKCLNCGSTSGCS